MAIQMDYFSRRLNKAHYDNAVKIFAQLKKNGASVAFPKITTWELYDKSFTFPRVRRYSMVSEAMNQLEHFEDNANQNLSNSQSIDSFMKNASIVRSNLTTKYAEAFKDPSTFDPQSEKVKTWAD